MCCVPQQISREITSAAPQFHTRYVSAILLANRRGRLNCALQATPHEIGDARDVLVPVEDEMLYMRRVLPRHFLHRHALGTPRICKGMDALVRADSVLLRVEEQLRTQRALGEEGVVSRLHPLEPGAEHEATQGCERRVEPQGHRPDEGHCIAEQRAPLDEGRHDGNALPEANPGGATVKDDTSNLGHDLYAVPELSIHQGVDERSPVAEHMEEERMLFKLEIIQQSKQCVGLIFEYSAITPLEKLLNRCYVANCDAPLVFVDGTVL